MARLDRKAPHKKGLGNTVKGTSRNNTVSYPTKAPKLPSPRPAVIQKSGGNRNNSQGYAGGKRGLKRKKV
jgi:hypothetical protein